MSSGKGAAGTGFQVTLEIESAFPVSEGDNNQKFPRSVLVGVDRATGVVVGKAGFHLFREADVELSGVFEASEDINVVHA